MRWFSVKTFLEVFNQIFINMTAAWFALAFVSPGIFGVSSIQQYFELLLRTLPFGIVGLIFSSWLAERNKTL